MLYDDLRDPIALLRGQVPDTRLSHYWSYAAASDPRACGKDEVAAYSDLMGASQPLVAGEVLAAYSLGRHRCLLDVGGGDGSFLLEVARAVPGLRLMLFDLPPVAERARGRFAQAGIDHRASVMGGDFHKDPLPTGADIVSLVRVIHDHDDAQALGILKAVRQAVPQDGVLLLAEPMAGTAGAEPAGDAYFGFYLLAMKSGRPRTPDELRELLRRAGFSTMRLVATRTPLFTRLIVARP